MSSKDSPPFPNGPQRLAGLLDQEFTESARTVLGSWWPPFNIHRVLARNPETLASWLPFGTHILRHNSLGERNRELVVLRIAWNARSGYEWGQHAGLSSRLGIPEADIARVAGPLDPAAWSSLEAALLSGVDEMMRSWSVADATYATLAEHLSDAQLIDYVMLVAEFVLVALVLNVFQIERDPGLPEFPA